MNKNSSVSISDHFAKFVEGQVAKGRFSSASDVVSAGLKLLEDHETKLEALQQALIEGEKSGPTMSFDLDAMINDRAITADLRLSPRAADDLKEIWSSTESQWHADQANRHVRNLQRTMELLGETPDLGTDCDYIRPRYRKNATGSYVLFYKQSEHGIEVVRILHKSADLEANL